MNVITVQRPVVNGMASRMLRHARRRAGLTQRQLAGRTGIPQETIARIEARRMDPRVTTLDRLLEGCGFGLEHLPRLGMGIDRPQIQALLALSPSERLGLAVADDRPHAGAPTELAAGRRVSELARFRPEEILRRLVDARVAFVVVGGLAAQAHGSPSLTRDLDICYARDHDNLARLAGVLDDVAAVRRGLPADAPRMPPLDARTLRAGGLFTLTTRFGDFDLLADPDPGLDFESLSASASLDDVEGVAVLVAGLDDLIEMKRAAGRPKDRVELEILGALREEIDRRP